MKDNYATVSHFLCMCVCVYVSFFKTNNNLKKKKFQNPF